MIAREITELEAHSVRLVSAHSREQHSLITLNDLASDLDQLFTRLRLGKYHFGNTGSLLPLPVQNEGVGSVIHNASMLTRWQDVHEGATTLIVSQFQ